MPRSNTQRVLIWPYSLGHLRKSAFDAAVLVGRILGRFDSVRSYHQSLEDMFRSVRPAYLAPAAVLRHRAEILAEVPDEGRRMQPTRAMLRPPPRRDASIFGGKLASMSEVTRILSAIEAGDPRAAAELLPLVYDELRRLAAARLAAERLGQTLQPTALVHEAYLRLVGGGEPQDWNSRGHFFAAAAEAMRRILVESARRKGRQRHGGGRRQIELDEAISVAAPEPSEDLLDLDEALTRLEATDPTAAGLVKLRYFAGLSMPDAAAALGLPLRTAERNWTYARTWLHRELSRSL
jgi:RNA polymerase sigma factor (TIGR02999 family)